MTTFYIVRHGQTEMNKAHLIQGHLDSPLTPKGEEEAKELAGKFKDINFDMVFSSDLLRAKRTAEIIKLERKIEVETAQLLRERYWGEFEGKPSENFDKYYELMKKMSDEERKNYKPSPDFESDEETFQRIITFIRETAIRFPGKNILVVSHGTIIRMLLIHLGFGTYLELGPGSLTNCGYVKIETDGADINILETEGLTRREITQVAG